MKHPDPVRAAGALVWRRRGEALQVLLVHNTAHGEWGWPKGKVEKGEHLSRCAVREVAEETGVAVRLGIPLPGTSYVLPDGTPKTVRYWAAQVRDGQAHPASPDEIDAVEWLGIGAVRQRLSRWADAAPLEELLRRDALGELDTWPLLLLRHATAVKRAKWDGSDAERPLTTGGRAAAAALVDLLAAWAPEQVITSPWQRCRRTVVPFAESRHLEVRDDPRLTETGDARERDGALEWLGSVIAADAPTLACTHRPVLPALLEAVRSNSTPTASTRIPLQRPLLEKGEFLVLQVRRRTAANRDEAPVVAMERVAST